MALFRAIESSRPAGARLFRDPLATAFLDPGLRLAAGAAALPMVGRLVPAYIDRRWPGPRPSAVVRTRVIDDAVRGALAGGCSQLVLLGAGYDTRALRLAEARAIEAFEVDHPVTQAAKREALARATGELPATVHFVAVNFERDSLAEALDRAGLRRGIGTCIVWEGVFSYLTPEAIDATLRWTVQVSGPGSRLILTYIDAEALRPTGRTPAWIAAVERAGEPFATGLDPEEAAGFFADRGLRLVSDESTRESAASLLPEAAETIPGFYRVAVLEPLASVNA